MPPKNPPDAVIVKVEPERSQFTALILQNPNHFGNLQESLFKPVKPIASNTTYEELKCVGFQPQLNRLEAVVWVKQAAGYNGGLCSNGSTEYVGFWLSHDNGASWLYEGTESFKVYDIPGDHPLEYAVSLAITPFRRLCFTENLPLVRAVLSWNLPPTDPHTPPVWGNAVEARIQIAPGFNFNPLVFLKEAGVELKAEIETLIDPAQTLKLSTHQALSPALLNSLYAGKDVPGHRFLHGELVKYLAHPELAVAIQPAQPQSLFSDLGIDVSKLFSSFFATQVDTGFEELTCIGLDPDRSTPDALMGVLRIKRPNGYLGGLCSPGSTEYVAFWIDWGDGVWAWQGTASVGVHDIHDIPLEGLSYAVYLPVNLEPHRKPCEQGPVTARVRAILSWSTPPPPSNPNYVPAWGNRLETHVHIDPGVPAVPGDYTPYIQSLCETAVCDIDQATGFALGDQPFGGFIKICGDIPGAPNVKTAESDLARYRISVRPVGGTWQPVTDDFPLTLETQIDSGIPTSHGITQQADAGGYYIYREAPPVPSMGWQTVSPSRQLAQWNSLGKTGLWEIKIEALDPVTGISYVAGTVECESAGTIRQNVVIDLDQQAPVTSLHITGYQPGGVGPVLTDILDCGTFQVGDVLHGSYSVSDEHFRRFSLTAEPFSGGSFTIDGLALSSRDYPQIPTSGQSGTWTFNTANLPACGYTIQLSASDRTIASCDYGGWPNNGAFVGFCLVLPKP
jgi:hypothetical protein